MGGLEFFVGRKFTPHLGVKGGATANCLILDSPRFVQPQGFLFFAF